MILAQRAGRRRWTTRAPSTSDGWVLVEDGLVAAVGGGEPPAADERVDLARRRRHAGPRQHAPPPLPDAHARPGAGGRPLHVAADALPGLGADRRRDASTPPRAPASPSSRSPAARPSSTTTTSSRAASRGLVEAEMQRGARARRAHRRLARLDGPRRVATAACRPTRSSRTIDDDPRRHRAARRRSPTATMVQIAVAPCSPFSVTTRADGGVGRARAPARAAAAHAPRRDGRGGGVLPRALRLPAGRVPRAARLARRRRLVRALRPPLRRRTSRAFGAHGVGVAHCPTSNLRLGAGVAPVRELLDAGVRVGLGVDGSASNERSDLFLEVKQALLVARGRGGPRAR